MQRRKYLSAVGSGTILVTTGCLSDNDEVGSEGSDNDDGGLGSQTDEVDSSSDTKTATQGNKDESTRSPVSTVEQFYHLAVEARSPDSVNRFINISKEMTALLHSQSPLQQQLKKRIESPPSSSELPDNNIALETLKTEVAYEDLDETTLREAYPELAEKEDSSNSLNPITAAAADNVIVEATTDASVAQALGFSLTTNWIVTTENDEWRLIR